MIKRHPATIILEALLAGCEITIGAHTYELAEQTEGDVSTLDLYMASTRRVDDGAVEDILILHDMSFRHFLRLAARATEQELVAIGGTCALRKIANESAAKRDAAVAARAKQTESKSS